MSLHVYAAAITHSQCGQTRHPPLLPEHQDVPSCQPQLTTPYAAPAPLSGLLPGLVSTAAFKHRLSAVLAGTDMILDFWLRDDPAAATCRLPPTADGIDTSTYWVIVAGTCTVARNSRQTKVFKNSSLHAACAVLSTHHVPHTGVMCTWVTLTPLRQGELHAWSCGFKQDTTRRDVQI